MAKILRIVEDHKADKGVRFANYLIDIAFTFIVVLSVSFVIGVIIALTSTSIANEISDEIDNNNSLLDNLLGMLLLVSVMFFSASFICCCIIFISKCNFRNTLDFYYYFGRIF